MKFKKYPFIWYLLLLYPLFTYGQSSSTLIDSLKHRLKAATEDTTRSHLLVSLGNQISPSDSMGGLHLLKEALIYANKAQDDYYQANAYGALGRFYQIYYMPDSAKFYYKKAEALLAKHPHNMAANKLFLLLKQNYLTLISDENPKIALNGAFQLIPVAEKLNDQVTLGNLFTNIGVWLMNIANYEKAIPYFKKSVEVKITEPKQYARFAYSYVDLAACYYRIGEAEQMLPYLKKAKSYLLKAKDRPEIWAWYYNYLGLYMYYHKRYKQAEMPLHKGLTIAKEQKDYLAQSNILGTLVKVHQAMGNNQQALQYVQTDYHLQQQKLSKKNMLGTLMSMANIQEKLGYYKQGYYTMRSYALLADSLREQEKSSELLQIEDKYETANKEKQILTLKHENEVKSFALQKNRLYTGLLMAISFLLLTLAVLYFQFNQHHKKQLKQHQQLHQLEMEKINQQNKISLLSAMLHGQESERNRISRDLHDGLGGLLSALKIELSGTLKPEPMDRQATSTILKKMDYAVDELRLISQNLMPETLIKYGLGEAIKAHCLRMRNKGVQLVCQIFHYKNELEQEKELILYRIMQELVSNAIKHACAHTIFVQLIQSENKITLIVEDDGKGFDKKILDKPRKGNGLTNIMSRIEYIDGELDIHSETGNGTTFTIECTIRS
ncbi:hypothetical protein GCM10023231_22330 [Olivibacter ginsenosidimutans]|uniref:histidine kinase n=1 Tax=Olivibacter ginsenosidimutans TaxID=1176537 RepID=A0ABP9BC85_9SPHI